MLRTIRYRHVCATRHQTQGHHQALRTSYKVPELLDTIQRDLFTKADAEFRSHCTLVTEWEKVVPALEGKNVVLIPFCEEPVCEERIKELTKGEEKVPGRMVGCNRSWE